MGAEPFPSQPGLQGSKSLTHFVERQGLRSGKARRRVQKEVA
jgi:hypothetical protein